MSATKRRTVRVPREDLIEAVALLRATSNLIYLKDAFDGGTVLKHVSRGELRDAAALRISELHSRLLGEPPEDDYDYEVDAENVELWARESELEAELLEVAYRRQQDYLEIAADDNANGWGRSSCLKVNAEEMRRRGTIAVPYPSKADMHGHLEARRKGSRDAS